jgi:hypothetical protein
MHLPCYDCVLCQAATEETLFHLLLGCPFARECWIHLGLYVDAFQAPFFKEILIIMC